MRAIITSGSKSCRACGALNSIKIWTAGDVPDWPISCSQCGATLVEARKRSPEGSTESPAAPNSIDLARPADPVASRAPHTAPHGASRPSKRTRISTAPHTLPPAQDNITTYTGRRPLRHKWGIHIPSRALAASTAAGVVAACGLAFAFLAPENSNMTQESMRDLILSESEAMPVVDDFTVDTPATAVTVPSGELVLVEAESPRDIPSPHQLPQMPISLGLQTHEMKVGVPAIPQDRAGGEAMLREPEAASPNPDIGIGTGTMHQRIAALMTPDAAEEAEAGLELSLGERREVQRRLRLAEHNPRSIDGIFGPATRAAIISWQAQANIPVTGYVTKRALSRLVAETNDAYRAWRVAVAARRDQELRLASAPVPQPRSTPADQCARLRSGEIAYGRTFRCDVRGLREDLGAVGQTLAQIFGGSERSHSMTMHRARKYASRDQG